MDYGKRGGSCSVFPLGIYFDGKDLCQRDKGDEVETVLNWKFKDEMSREMYC